jgi:hypothetical protein
LAKYKKSLKNIWWFEFNFLYLYSKLIKMNITEFNEMNNEMINLLEWVSENYLARANNFGVEFHHIADDSWGANPLTPAQVVNEYMKKVWIKK